MKNVIILTGGLAGSSVLTALLNRSGYWVGDETIKKERDYDTWENAELVRLNRQIIQDAGFTDDWTMEFSPDYIDKIGRGFDRLDPAPYQAFAAQCAAHQPWIWKDPRLWLTMRYWIRFLDRENLVFLTIRREEMQAWISTTIRRQIQTMEHARWYGGGINQSIQAFLDQEGLPHFNVLFEDLLMQPERVLEDLCSHTGAQVSMDDFRSVFRGRLGQRQHGVKNWLLASAIYLKNYGERYRLIDGRSVPPRQRDS